MVDVVETCELGFESERCAEEGGGGNVVVKCKHKKENETKMEEKRRG